jgi:branched-subunit amino acid transport protein
MSDTWTVVLALTAATAVIRASGPVLIGGRELPPIVIGVIALLAPALLAALVAVGTFTGASGDLELDARAAGLAAAAGVLVWSRNALLAVVAAAALAAALVRALA